MYYKGAAAAIVVYDMTRPESFGTLQKWVAELRDKGPEDIRICVAGNKKDLEAQRKVEAADAEVRRPVMRGFGLGGDRLSGRVSDHHGIALNVSGLRQGDRGHVHRDVRQGRRARARHVRPAQYVTA